MHWLAYGFRHYDPVVGRFTGVDPLADLFPSQSSYLYAYDNPIRFTDVDGLYGDENEANRQRQTAIDQGVSVGDVYQSGDGWGFNVINGQGVPQIQTTLHGQTLDLSGLPSGLYLLVLESPTRQLAKKILIP